MQVLSLIGIDWDFPTWLLITVGLCVAYYVYMTWNFNEFKKLNIKGPKPSPVFGNLRTFMKRGFDYDGDMIKEYGDPVGVFNGREPVMIVADPEILRAIFVKEFDNFIDRSKVEIKSKPMGRALTSVRGNDWRQIRNTLTPTFSTGKLKVMLKLTNQCADQLAENVQAYAEQEAAFDFAEYCGAYTMDVIARTGFGYELNTQRDPNNKFILMAKKIMGNASFRNPFVFVMFFLPFLTGIVTKLNLVSVMNREAQSFFLDFARQAFQERRKDDKKESVDFLQLMVNAHEMPTEDDEQTDGGKGEHRSKKRLTEDEILANILTFFLAGYETTANTLSILGYKLAINPEVQDKLIEEIDKVVPNKAPTYEDLHKMPYIEQVLAEVLRMYPQAPLLTRSTEKAITIKGVYFPEGMQVRIPVKYLHYNPDIYPEPEKFKPERFTPEQKASRDPYVYLPFGLGPRMCIGNRLALMEIKIALIRILQKFRITTCEETQIPIKLQHLRVKPDGKLMLKVVKRS